MRSVCLSWRPQKTQELWELLTLSVMQTSVQETDSEDLKQQHYLRELCLVQYCYLEQMK